MTDTPPPYDLRRLLGRDMIETAAVFTFLLAVTALVLVGLLAAIGAIFAPQTVDMPMLMRVTDVALRVVAVSILVAFMARKITNTFLVTFSIIVIAALIVPSQDIVRFLLLASNSERRYDAFFSRSNVSSLNLSSLIKPGGISARFSETSHQLSYEIERYLLNEELVNEELGDGAFPPETQTRLREIIDRGLDGFIVQLAAVEVVANGAVNALLAVSEGEDGFPRWVSLYGSESVTVQNLGFLKSKGLISFPIDDFREAEVTPFGEDVVDQILPLGGRDQVNRIETVPRAMINLGDQDVDELIGQPRTINLTQDVRQLTLTSDTARSVTLHLNAVMDAADPFLILYDEQGNQIAEDDDSGDGLNSAMILTFDPDQSRTIGMRAYGGDSGQATLSASEYPP